MRLVSISPVDPDNSADCPIPTPKIGLFANSTFAEFKLSTLFNSELSKILKALVISSNLVKIIAVSVGKKIAIAKMINELEIILLIDMFLFLIFLKK